MLDIALPVLNKEQTKKNVLQALKKYHLFLSSIDERDIERVQDGKVIRMSKTALERINYIQEIRKGVEKLNAWDKQLIELAYLGKEKQMWTFFIILGLGVACIILFLMMSNHDMNKLDVFKKENPEMYEKYKGAFDSQPGDFSMVKLSVESVESRLLPEETICYSFAQPRYQNKDMNVYVLTDKRYIYYGIRLTKKAFKSIPYNKIESVDVKEKAFVTELEVKSKEEKIDVFFGSYHKKYFDEFYIFLTEKQLNPNLGS